MIVMKFGGTSVGSAERIGNLTRIVRSRIKSRPVVVVSALHGVTDALIEFANSSLSNRGAAERFNWIRERHYKVIADLGLENSLVTNELNQLKKISDGISLLEELTPKTLDTIMSFGERMSSRIIAAYMSREGMPATAYDAYDIGMVTDSNFGDADVTQDAYPRIKRALAKSESMSVITGFIGKTARGEITTLGRGGSDYTASIIGSAIGASVIEIWTDVDGIMTADPKIVKSARNIETISYDEASELAFMGAKVLHPKTILPAINKNIPVKILNTFNPSHKGTTVLRSAGTKNRVASIACKKRINVINIHTPKMFLMHGFLRKVFEIFDSLGLSVDMVSTSEVNVSVTLDGRHDTKKLVEELRKIADVEVSNNRAKISIVGSGLVYRTGILGQIFSTLSDVKVEMISASTSEINRSFVVREEDADQAIRSLHKTFFGR